MILVCVAIPLLLALAGRWLPHHRGVAPIAAGLTLAACLSLPWTGFGIGEWLVADPLGVHVAVLAAFAWLAASLLEASGEAGVAGVALCLILALLTGIPELTIVAACAGVIVAVLLLPPPHGPLLTIAASGLGLAVFGLALLHAAMPGTAGLSWDTLTEAATQARGAPLGVGVVFTLLGLGCTCLLLPIRAALLGAALPRRLTILAGPAGGVWLMVALRLRGVLDGNGHAIAPGGLLVMAGLLLMLVAVVCLRSGPERLLPGATLGVVGAAVFGFGLGDAGATASGLLHLTIGCIALAAVIAGGWAGNFGVAALVGVPPLGVFASAYGLFAAALSHSIALAVLFAALELALIILTLRRLAVPIFAPVDGRFAVTGWIGLGLTLVTSWALPAGVAAWLLGIAAASR